MGNGVPESDATLWRPPFGVLHYQYHNFVLAPHIAGEARGGGFVMNVAWYPVAGERVAVFKGST
jgi:hypothetical protein